MPNPSTATVTTAHSCSSSTPKRTARCAANPGAGASDVIPFDRLAAAARQRTANAQTLRRAQAAKALEETSKHVAEALKLLEPFNTAIVIAPTAHLLRMCANGMARVFDDLDHIGLAQSTVCSAGTLAQSSTHDASAVKRSADVLPLAGVQREGGAQ